MKSMVLVFSAVALLFLACGGDDDDGGNAAARLGIGDACENDEACPPLEESDAGLECLPFKAGYCGLTDCAGDEDCPSGSACVTHEGANYCFLVCVNKEDCNVRREAEDEANCVGNAEFVSERDSRKACVPPS